MEIRKLIPHALETLERQTKAAPRSTKALTNFDFEFQTFGEKPLESMLAEARKFCAEMESGFPPRWLSFLGVTGAGKTHLTKRISRFFKTHLDGKLIPGQDTLRTQFRMRGGFLSWRKIADSLRNGEYGILSAIEKDYFVALDDIGSEYRSSSDFITSKLDQIVDARLGKWTVLTSNLTLEQIADSLDVRIASRLRRGGSVVLNIKTVPDFDARNSTL